MLLLQIRKLVVSAVMLMLLTVFRPSTPSTITLLLHGAVVFNLSFPCHLTQVNENERVLEGLTIYYALVIDYSGGGEICDSHCR